jgi:hypothetical protein
MEEVEEVPGEHQPTAVRAELRAADFPLPELPVPVLALVLFWLPLSDAAALARVSHKFAAAFRDNVSWKRRCVEDVKGIDVEAAFKEGEASRMAFYKSRALFTVRVVTVSRMAGAARCRGSSHCSAPPERLSQHFCSK